MSILIKGTNGNGGSSPSKGFPPGDVYNVVVSSELKTTKLKWSDPDTSIYNNITLSTWSSTIIVRKEGSAPSSIKDGTIILTNTERNKYASTPYTDSNVIIGKTYYYRFYTLSTNKVYNDSTSMIYSIKVTDCDTVLKNNTWDQINEASEAGIASSIWNIGDEIDIELSEQPYISAETVTLQIWDFKHFDKADGSGKAGIVFGMKNLMKSTQKMNSSDTNSGGWNDTYMKKTVMQNILKSMPSNLQSAIKEVTTYVSLGGVSSSANNGRPSTDKVFLPGLTEVYNGWSSQNQTEKNQKLFPIFTDDNSRIKKQSNGSGSAIWWWTRSPYYNNSSNFCNVNNTGNANNNNNASNSNGVCF